MFSAGYVGSSDQARDIVQEVFIARWENRQTLTIETSLKSYLFQAVRNRSTNALIKDNRIRTLKERLQFQVDQKSDFILNDVGFEGLPVLRVEKIPEPGLKKTGLQVFNLPE